MLEKNAVPYNARYDDVYFDANDPKGERESVYASAIDEVLKDEIIIAESGFGYGLNFFVSAKKALSQGKKLHYIACEIEPISMTDLRDFYANFSEFSELFLEFQNGFERLENEVLRLRFCGGKVILDFYFGWAKNWLKECDFRADIWYIDGFSPAKNPELFSADFLALVKEHCAKDAILRSYSCARIFKDALSQSGFVYEKRAGQGKKREFLSAICPKPEPKKYTLNPWFAPPKDIKKPKTALIIGAGIAGLISAFELGLRGINCVILEQLSGLNNGASSNKTGLMLPLINKPCSKLGAFHLSAFLSAWQFYKEHEIFAPFVDFCGVNCVPSSKAEFERFKSANSDILRFDGKNIFISKAAQITPLALRTELANSLEIHFKQKVSKIKAGDEISVLCESGSTYKADALVLCGGASGNELVKSFDNSILLSSVRGQSTLVSPFWSEIPLSGAGYICKEWNSTQLIGSTFDRESKNSEPQSADDLENIAKIKDFLDSNNLGIPKILGSNVGFRSYSGDRFALIGAIHDENAFKESYKALLWTKNKATQPNPTYLKNIFINTAHGAHALSTAIFGANIIADMLSLEPLGLTHSLFSELHPARFLIRKLKKGL